MWYRIKASVIGGLQKKYLNKIKPFLFFFHWGYVGNCFPFFQDGRVFIWTCDDPAGNTWTAKLLHKFNDVVWHVSWSITGNILAVSGGDNKVENTHLHQNPHKIIDIIWFPSVWLGYMQTKHATVWKNIFLKRVFIDMVLSTCSELGPYFF